MEVYQCTLKKPGNVLSFVDVERYAEQHFYK